MLGRERVMAALGFEESDVVSLQIYPAAGGLYEHGQKLVDLIKECGHDFGDLRGLVLPEGPGAEDFDEDGSYHAIKTDEWGTTWEYRVFGIWGHPIGWPLNDLSKLDSYRCPSPPAGSGVEFEREKAEAEEHKREYYLLGGGGSLFETLHSIRRFEDVLMDIALDTLEINRILDMLVENAAARVARSLALGADGVQFGDDFGTQTGPILGPEVWRRVFKPRYRELFEPIRAAGKTVLFHSCGQIGELLEDFAELGVGAIWPQLPAFEMGELARRCRELGLAVQLHPDRGDLMQTGRPGEVRDYVREMIEVFGAGAGGSWLYVEVDPGFPYANVEALFEVAMELRG